MPSKRAVPRTALERKWYAAGLKAAERILGLHQCGGDTHDQCDDCDFIEGLIQAIAAKRKELEGKR